MGEGDHILFHQKKENELAKMIIMILGAKLKKWLLNTAPFNEFNHSSFSYVLKKLLGNKIPVTYTWVHKINC